jgi:hypothetical protein
MYTHTLDLVTPQTTLFYREGSKVSEWLRCAQSHSNLGSGRAKTQPQLWLNAKPVLHQVPALNCLTEKGIY